MIEKFDLVIVGAGSGNMIPNPSFEGYRIAVVEEDKFGGTCLNRGCIPSKMLIYAADVANTVRNSSIYGVNGSIEGIDWERVIGRVWQRIDPLPEKAERWRGRQSGTKVYKGRAHFIGEKLLEVAGERITAEHFVIAAGSRPYIPNIPGLQDVAYHTSDTVMRLQKQPERMAIVGGGYISAEMGHFFSAMGTKVVILERHSHLLMSEDAEVRERFTDVFSRHCDVMLNSSVVAVKRTDEGASLEVVDGSGEQRSSVNVDTVLIASGRVPNSDRLNLEATGIEVNSFRRIVTDEYLETTCPGVWALGDLSSPIALKHRANREARVIVYNIANPDNRIPMEMLPTPHAVFTSPQVASIGYTEQELKSKQIPYVVGRKNYSATAYGWAMEDKDSFVKVLASPETRKLLGAHIIGPHASILIQTLVNAVHLGESADDVARNTMYVHPALTEVVEQALLEL